MKVDVLAGPRELAAIRQRFNRSSAGGWGILFDPFHGCWIAVRGRNQTVRARTATELGDRLVSGLRARHPLAAAPARVHGYGRAATSPGSRAHVASGAEEGA